VESSQDATPLSEPTQWNQHYDYCITASYGANLPGLSIEHGQIYQHGKPRSVAMNGRGIHQVSLRTTEGRVLTLPVCRLFEWQA
jgi:hypothetical protein